MMENQPSHLPLPSPRTTAKVVTRHRAPGETRGLQGKDRKLTWPPGSADPARSLFGQEISKAKPRHPGKRCFSRGAIRPCYGRYCISDMFFYQKTLSFMRRSEHVFKEYPWVIFIKDNVAIRSNIMGLSMTCFFPEQWPLFWWS